jgi:hypothetical protein
MTIDKQYHDPLEGTGKGQMLTGGTDVKGSGVYVAIERVTGKLDGLSGSFTLQHGGTMTRGVPQLVVTSNGKHFYEFEYTLAKSQ